MAYIAVMGYFQCILGYFRVEWPVVLGYLAFQAGLWDVGHERSGFTTVEGVGIWLNI